MARKPEQGKRRAAFESGLGTDVLAITGFEAQEEINQLFEMRVDAVSDQNDLNFTEWLTKEKGVASIPTSVFYENLQDRKVIRFCFAKDDETLLKSAEILCKI